MQQIICSYLSQYKKAHIDAYNRKIEEKKNTVEGLDGEKKIKLKVYYGNQIKITRKSLKEVESISLLEDVGRALFPELEKFDIQLKYVDEDGDFISLVDVRDLSEMFADGEDSLKLRFIRNGLRKRKIVTGEDLHNDGIAALDAGEYKKAHALFMQLFRSCGSYIALYNAACASSLNGDMDLACEILKKSVVLGYDNLEHIKVDEDLENIRSTEEYKNIVEVLESRLNYRKYFELQAEVLKLLDDQNPEGCERAISLLSEQLELRPNDPVATYNKACAYSLLKRSDEAVSELNKAIELGLNNWEELIETDTDLDNIRHLPTFPNNEPEPEPEPEPVKEPEPVVTFEDLYEETYVNPEHLSTLTAMGFSEEVAKTALKTYENNVNFALEYLLTNNM